MGGVAPIKMGDDLVSTEVVSYGILVDSGRQVPIYLTQWNKSYILPKAPANRERFNLAGSAGAKRYVDATSTPEAIS